MIKRSLQRQFTLWTVLLVVVPSALIMTIYTIGQLRNARQESLEMLTQRVAAQDRLIDYWMAERIVDVRILSKTRAFRALDEENMRQVISSSQIDNKNFDSLSYIDKDGVFRISTLSGGIKFPSAIGRPYYQAALAGKEYVSDVVSGRNSGRQIVNFSSPVYDYAGNFQGLILGSIRTATLEALLRDNWIGQTGEVYLVNQDGVMLTEPRFVAELINRGLVQESAKMKYKITEDVLRKIHVGESGMATWVDYSGNKVLGAYLNVPERGWTIVGKINETEVLTPIYRQLAIMAAGTIILVLMILPLAAQITRRIKKPVDWLIAQTYKIEMENYDLVVQTEVFKNSPHELDILCNTFVEMGQKIRTTIELLKEKEDELKSKIIELQDVNTILEEEITERQSAQNELQQLNLQLETRVAKRTSELQAINNALTISEARYRALFDHMLDAFNIRKVILDKDGRPVDLEYIVVNPAFERMFDLRAEDIIGRRMTAVFPDITKDSFNWIEMLGEVALTGEPLIVEAYFGSANKWLRLEAYCPEKGLVAAVMQDITDNKRSEEQRAHYSEEIAATNTKLLELNEELRRISQADGLTGIANRRYFDEYLEREWRRAKREKSPLALIMLDVDFFKAYNDTYGHLAGDECLKLIANTIKTLPKRAADVAARYGGEEFVLILPDTDERGAKLVAEKVRIEVEKLGIEHNGSLISDHVTVSLGVAATVPEQEHTWSTIISAADGALYQAKQQGRNKVKVAGAFSQE